MTAAKKERQILDTSDIFQLLYFLKDTLHSNPFKTYFKNLTRKLSPFKFTYFYALFYIKSSFTLSLQTGIMQRSLI